jgi:hypothetical protein
MCTRVLSRAKWEACYIREGPGRRASDHILKPISASLRFLSLYDAVPIRVVCSRFSRSRVIQQPPKEGGQSKPASQPEHFPSGPPRRLRCRPAGRVLGLSLYNRQTCNNKSISFPMWKEDSARGPAARRSRGPLGKCSSCDGLPRRPGHDPACLHAGRMQMRYCAPRGPGRGHPSRGRPWS